MLLKELLNDIKFTKVKGNINIDITDIHFDSRLVTKGSLFICVDGFKTTGHMYIEEAINKGAIAIVVDKDVEINNATIIKVKNTRKTMAKLAKNFYRNPTAKLPIIGVTGTNGKTSITYMIKSILEFYGNSIGVIGTISNWIGNKEVEAVRTTPEAPDLQKIFSQMVEEKVDACVMEVSSHALELGRVDACTYLIGVFTNLTPDHLDFHQNMDNYRNAKKKLFYKTTLCNIINVDDFHGKIIAKEIKDLRVPALTYAINEKADIYATNISTNIKGVSFDVHMPIGTRSVNVKIPGLFTVYNVMPVILICYFFGLSLDEICIALNSMKGIPGRFEIIDEIKDIAVIVDYAHTPDALENILMSAKKFSKNRIITVFGCGGDRDTSKRNVMGQISGSLSDYTIITSDNPRTEDPVKIIEMIEGGIKKVTNKYKSIIDRKSAIEYALKIAEKDDIIIIAGKGHETTQTIGKDVLPFDDRKIALEIARKEELI